MIPRALQSQLLERLASSPAVALLGSRQVGKTTLARSLNVGKPIVYLDLERPSDLAKLADPELFLGSLVDHLVVIDEVQLQPGLFPILRSLIDERRRQGENSGQFLLLGSASPELLRQGSETLAGRISYLELTPLLLSEIGFNITNLRHHWVRGGYPNSLLATSNERSLTWRNDFITSHIERYLPLMGVHASPLQLRRFCTMIAHQQASMVNLAQTGNALGLDGKTVRNYLDLVEGLFLVRRLPPWSRNVGKRLVKSPKVMWRDSGILHALLNISNEDQLLGHPIAGHSWEAYCIEQILALQPQSTVASFYRTHAGAEIDLVLEYADGRVHAIEIKRTLSPKLTPGLIESMHSIGATQASIIMPGGTTFPMAPNIEAVPLAAFLATGS
ncbi:MAG: ATP-binding protein [Ignavibacteriae bacterium]|nr:MAG: ATP-binding protein [Ignavibacteriota bacterium]